jgi:hypothetical protein
MHNTHNGNRHFHQLQEERSDRASGKCATDLEAGSGTGELRRRRRVRSSTRW